MRVPSILSFSACLYCLSIGHTFNMSQTKFFSPVTKKKDGSTEDRRKNSSHKKVAFRQFSKREKYCTNHCPAFFCSSKGSEHFTACLLFFTTAKKQEKQKVAVHVGAQWCWSVPHSLSLFLPRRGLTQPDISGPLFSRQGRWRERHRADWAACLQ